MRKLAIGLTMMLTGVMMAQSGAINTGVGSAASAAASSPGVDTMSAAQISERAKTLLAEARRSPSGNASVTLEKYPDHLTMLTVRTKSGGAEMHAKYADIFVVIDGEATEMTGGKIVDAKESSPGETRGLKVEGGVPHLLRKGDIIHIAPGTSHQTTVPEGKTFTYYVIKVAQ